MEYELDRWPILTCTVALVNVIQCSSGVKSVLKCVQQMNGRTGSKTNLFFLLQGATVKTTMPPPADIVKVAIEWPGANAQLIEMDQVCVCIQLDVKYISSFPLITST